MSTAQEIYDNNLTYSGVVQVADSLAKDRVVFDNGWSTDYVFEDGSVLEQRDKPSACEDSSTIKVRKPA